MWCAEPSRCMHNVKACYISLRAYKCMMTMFVTWQRSLGAGSVWAFEPGCIVSSCITTTLSSVVFNADTKQGLTRFPWADGQVLAVCSSFNGQVHDVISMCVHLYSSPKRPGQLYAGLLTHTRLHAVLWVTAMCTALHVISYYSRPYCCTCRCDAATRAT